MATIKEKRVNGKNISYKFTCYLGRDSQGKQIRRYKRWYAPEGMTPSKARKLAEREAERWETKIRKELGMDSWTPEAEKEKGQADSCVEFSDFVREVWFPLCIENGEYKAKTVSFYNDTAKNIANYFEGYSLQGVGFIAIQKFFVYLRRERGYSSQYIRHLEQFADTVGTLIQNQIRSF